jgi:hypothetical protein
MTTMYKQTQSTTTFFAGAMARNCGLSSVCPAVRPYL